VSSNVKKEVWQGDPLPRGRHKLDAEFVRASQRARLVRAMLETVSERGYEASTVPQVVARARVSRNAFYEFFADKADCFIAACDDQAVELLRAMVAFAEEPNWIDALRHGTGSYLRWWAARPAFARAYFIGLPAAGERAIAQRGRAYGLFVQMFAALGARARAEQPSLPPLARLVPRILVLSITELVAEEVRAGRTEQLPELEAELVAVAIKLLADDRATGRS
jgi:AcrR family transcriptional regulator